YSTVKIPVKLSPVLTSRSSFQRKSGRKLVRFQTSSSWREWFGKATAISSITERPTNTLALPNLPPSHDARPGLSFYVLISADSSCVGLSMSLSRWISVLVLVISTVPVLMAQAPQSLLSQWWRASLPTTDYPPQ